MKAEKLCMIEVVTLWWILKGLLQGFLNCDRYTELPIHSTHLYNHRSRYPLPALCWDILIVKLPFLSSNLHAIAQKFLLIGSFEKWPKTMMAVKAKIQPVDCGS